jgi:hypothetical protein
VEEDGDGCWHGEGYEQDGRSRTMTEVRERCDGGARRQNRRVILRCCDNARSGVAMAKREGRKSDGLR